MLRLKNFCALAVLTAIAISLLLARVGLHRADHEKMLHHDEPEIVSVAFNMAHRSNFNPHWFSHPASTQIYPLALAFRLFSNWQQQPTNDAERYPLAVRLVSYAYFVFCFWAAFFLIRRDAGYLASVVAIILAYHSKIFMDHAPFMRNDGTSIFFVTIALIFAGSAAKTSSKFVHFLAGVSVGAAIVTKFYLGFVGFAYLGSLLAQRKEGEPWNKLINRGLVAALGVGIGLFVFCPFLFLRFWEAERWITHQIKWISPSRPKLNFTDQFFYFINHIYRNIGIGGVVLGGVGLFGFWRQKNLPVLMTCVGGIFFLVVNSCTNAYYSRWILPLYPLFALLIANGLQVCLNQILLTSKPIRTRVFRRFDPFNNWRKLPP